MALPKARISPARFSPFILRDVTLAGTDSVKAAQTVRPEAWSRLAGIDLDKLAQTTRMIGLDEVKDVAAQVLQGKI
ncbi:hypothetical protein [Devosia sp. Leaf420]|uniref:hypothetical protein n=1 Tax=Devosia sp. Leaf420 TaxID=1736374 RepID=UPI000B0BAE97|nr:hypothetical protein [Devosia sp. Leaf420]